MPKPKINQSDNKVIISLNPRLYPLKSIYGAAYVFLDRAYIFLDGDPEKEILLHLKGKEKFTSKQLEKLANEFLNELLNYSLRYRISKDNRQIREYIVGTALLAASKVTSEIPTEPVEITEEWKKDPLGIAIPWEEKYKKK